MVIYIHYLLIKIGIKPQRFRKFAQPQIQKKEIYPRNERIKQLKVRVISSSGENIGIVDTQEALKTAYSEGLDLVLISPNQDIPVARIIDWSKFKYEQSKKHKKGHQVKNKEWWFYARIEAHDMKIKLSQIEKFVNKGNIAKLTVKFKKRTLYEELEATMNTVIELSSEFAEKASEIQKEGKNLSVLLKKK